MGNRTAFPSQSGGSIGREYCEFKIALGGAGAPTVKAGSSFLAVTNPATHSGGTNVVVVTMRDPWPEVVAHACDVRDDAGNGAYATIGSFTGENSQTVPPAPISFKIQTFNAGGTALNDSTLVVVVSLALRNSTTTYGNTP